jgi:hypothetical protein
MNIELLIIALLLLSVAVMYINLVSTTTECLRKNAINSSVSPDLTMMYINLAIAILLVLMSMIGIYSGIYGTQVTNTIDSNLQFLRT